MAALLTIDDLVRETGLEESLIRFYESEYAHRLPPTVERGGAVLFRPEAVAALREIHHGGAQAPSPEPAAGHEPRRARVLAVTSGKGGVGKSNIALNLAVACQRRGCMAIVIDADPGMANIHLLAGIQPAHTLHDYATCDLAASEVITAGPEGVGIIAGGSGILALADAAAPARARMLGVLAELERAADIIIVDTAAGMGAGVREFLRAADDVVFVLTPELTSLADAYGLLKGVSREGLSGTCHSIVNMAASLKQAAGVAVRFSRCAEQFLAVKVENIGYILKDSSVAAALANRRPFTVHAPAARASKNIANIAAAILRAKGDAPRPTSAFSRYRRLLAAAAEHVSS